MTNSEQQVTYKPDYLTTCMCCGETPVVTIVQEDEVTYRFGMCGPCTFGTAQALSTEYWSSHE